MNIISDEALNFFANVQLYNSPLHYDATPVGFFFVLYDVLRDTAVSSPEREYQCGFWVLILI